MEMTFSLESINNAAIKFLREIGEAKAVALHGDMGAGKTTFVHAVCKELGVTDPVSSPTFSIINEYTSANGQPVYHLDLYRLKSSEEAIAAGVEDCLYSGHLCFAEWPEIAPTLFPEHTVHCHLKIIGHNERMLRINL